MFSNKYKLLMISGIGASVLAQGRRGGFYYMLQEFSKYWERVDVICPSVEADLRGSKRGLTWKVHGNVFLHPSPWSLWRQPWFILKKGFELYKKQKFDLFTVHSYPPFYNDIGGRFLFNKINVPYVLEIMHIAGYPKAGNFKEWFYKILTRLFIKYDVKKARIVRIINKKQTPGFLKKTRIDEKKLKYIPAFYIDLDIFKPQNVEKKYDLVFAGRLVKNKGIDLLLKAVEILKLQNPNIKLIIIGSGPLENKIRKYIKRHSLQKNVFFAGWLATAYDLAKAYNQSKIFVMPSFNEGGPRTPLEAMACNVPVITSRVGIMIDMIEHGKNGLFIDWDAEDIAEKILFLLKDEELRKKITENGYKTIQQFERKEAIKNYALSCQRLIE